MLDISVLHPSQVDYEEYSRLVNFAFEEVLQHSEETLTPKLFEWKHRNPFGEAKVATIRENGALIAVNAMFPLKIVINGDCVGGWQSCESATHPGSRGRGLFFQCLSALQEHVKPDEVFLGFPNANSKPGFLRAGWKEFEEITTWLRPVVSPGFAKTGNVFGLTNSISTPCPLQRTTSKISLFKNIEYLRWRYENHPVNEYFFLGRSDNTDCGSYLVFRYTKIRGRLIALIMDLCASDSSTLTCLMQLIHHLAWRRRARAIVYLGSGVSRMKMLRRFFVPLPRTLLPKNHVLMGQLGSEVDHLASKSWLIQTGDWDAF